jgi:hypothetical protein
MNKQNCELNAYIDTTWTPSPTSTSEALAETLMNKEFQAKLVKLHDAYKGLTPTYIAEYERCYILMADRLKVLESAFDFGDLWFSYDFINRDVDEPICVGTLLVMTGEGYKPWLSRMGRGNAANPSSDGVFADAETSAKRRLLAALGLGGEGENEIAETSKRNARAALTTKLTSSNDDIGSTIKSYQAHYTRFEGLTPLSPEVGKDKDPTIGKLSDKDVENLLSFINARGSH